MVEHVGGALLRALINHTMRDKIYTYLKSQKVGVASNELVEQVFKIKGASPNISEKLVQTALDGDRRFAVDERRQWRIIENGGISLSEAEFVFLSLLTIDTVERPKTLIEISAQKLRGNKIIGSFHTCINPGSFEVPTIPLPPDLAQEIKGGVRVEKAVHSLFNFFGEAVLVGYDIRASINQLNLILNKLNETIENPSLCLKYLTKKLIPNLNPKSLNDVVSFFKLPIMDIRCTEKEVCVIADIFSKYHELLKKQGFNMLEEALEFQYPNIEYVDFSKYAFDKSFLRTIPQKPGVYRIINKGGEVIYVGKAKNLKVRIGSYFWNTADRLQKIADLLSNVYTIEYEVVGSELAAMLSEYRLIKQYQPKINQQFEVHERAATYGNLKNFILLSPSLNEESVELFFVKEELPIQRYEVLKNAVNLSGIERIIAEMYSENIQHSIVLSDVEAGEIDIMLSWVDTNKDHINYINMDTVCDKEACLKLVKDYIRDEETLQKKHFRLL